MYKVEGIPSLQINLKMQGRWETDYFKMPSPHNFHGGSWQPILDCLDNYNNPKWLLQHHFNSGSPVMSWGRKEWAINQSIKARHEGR